MYREELLKLLNNALSFLTEELDVATIGTDDGRSTSAARGSKVFIVHGHDNAALAILQTVAGQPVNNIEVVRTQVMLASHHLDSALWAN